MSSIQANDGPTLKRVISLPLITLYGIGGIVGAGIYVLIGKITAIAGLFSPFAFLVAASIALFSALSYAELSSRIPSSGGEVTYVHEGFRVNWLSIVVGLAICLGGIVSSAAIAKGAAGYLQVYFDTPSLLLVIIFVASIGAIACWGVLESVVFAAVITALEIGGLIVACAIGGSNIPTLFADISKLVPAVSTDWIPVISAALLAFYAYIGFEDMVNMGDEVKNPNKNMPLAILWALVISTSLYIIVALVFISSVPMDVLSSTDAPFVELVQRNSDFPIAFITVISLLAITNGALVQIIMSTRILYGMSRHNFVPVFLGQVHPKTRTPVIATLLVTCVVLMFALMLPVESLARVTSFLLLGVFTMVNLSLVLMKRREKSGIEAPVDNTAEHFVVPVFVPIAGCLLCASFLFIQLWF